GSFESDCEMGTQPCGEEIESGGVQGRDAGQVDHTERGEAFSQENLDRLVKCGKHGDSKQWKAVQ
ncbi:MAG: hypothetical protein QOG80_3008, partial [Pseudonocardiales bacterium]|nr:hypothetical protein [Pseudonocardiales bacterium]